MKYFLGVDAGGSKTHAMIADEQGKVIGVGKGGIGNHQINREQAVNSLQQALSEAIMASGLTKDQLDYSWFGLAGADREADFRILRPIISSFDLPQTEISCDTWIALRSGTEKNYGIVLICGSGVNCSGKNPLGATYQCGGFGYRFGDYGGGYDLSIEVFRSVLRADEGREKETVLTERLTQLLGYSNVSELREDYLDHFRDLPPHIAELLFQAAEEGDQVATELLVKQGDELGLAAVSAIRRLGMEEDFFDIVLAGSLLTKGDRSGIIRRAIERRVKLSAPNGTLRILTREPVVGSVVLAMESSGMRVDQKVLDNLSQGKVPNTIG
ncbi:MULTISPECIES: BadF/BadG/BcrA/BcrD ATPase family protein [Paenibacillus]|uniref:ATPase n=1 Tax=Paenibacillus odorifer TaxID=189426 RepID=A0A1R0XD24_9BACL|nr:MULTISPECIES: BadF/BadG/BcrA/BcrD ATPase family protein [Paenibacillus]AIQ73058.1 ATPase [Paenibacillus odorifer]ETT69069.1 BadF/BadG/BcrA/BcrD type ATPase [Paenibacillus sp. FSL H8-237]MEC0130031.1 BadF/BadG/BcrA/BcrD ATPase family protein [Paenibacillus odorifer]MEC0223118.1 BadF/BadG/BcrA/BcrD ATPase family protein [Paenibacillus odorifer]OMD07018.1 ATPase [Paenibacillus odorifer]